MLVAHGVAQADLGVEIAPLGVQHVDVIGASGTVLQVRQLDVFARRIAQIQLQGRRFAGAAIGDHSVVGLLEDRQDFLLVGQTRFVVSRQRGTVAGLLAAETEDRRSERPGDIRERRTEKSAQGVVFETACQIERQARKPVGVGHARCSHRRTEPLLGRPDVGTALQQPGGQSDGQAVSEFGIGIHLAAHHPPVGIFTHEQQDAVLHDLDFAFEVRNQRGRRGVLHLRLLIDHFGGETALEPQLHLIESLAARNERTPHDRQLVIQRDEVEVGRGDGRHQRHAHRPPVLDRSEVFGAPFAFGPAQVAPQIQLPAERDFGPESGVAARFFTGVVVGLVVAVSGSRDRRQAFGPAHPVQLPQALHARGGGEHVPVVVQRAFDDLAEGRIAVEPPPLHVGNGQGVGILPGDALRQIDVGRFAVPHGRAGDHSGRCGQQNDYRKSFHRFSFALIL